MRQVICTEPTICWTSTFIDHNIRGMGSLSILPICAEFFIHVVRSEIQFLTFSMSGAVLGHEDLTSTFKNFCVQYHVTIWTYTLGEPYGMFRYISCPC